MKNLITSIKNAWKRTREAAARLLQRQIVTVIQRIDRVLYVARPKALRVSKLRISSDEAARFGQMALPF